MLKSMSFFFIFLFFSLLGLLGLSFSATLVLGRVATAACRVAACHHYVTSTLLYHPENHLER